MNRTIDVLPADVALGRADLAIFLLQAAARDTMEKAGHRQQQWAVPAGQDLLCSLTCHLCGEQARIYRRYDRAGSHFRLELRAGRCTGKGG